MRRFWWLILAYTALNTVANYVWNVPRASPAREELDLSDALYLVDYCILTAAFAFMFARAGGTFGRLRVWLDATTMVAVQLVALWSVFLAPALPREMGRSITMAATFSYSFVLSVMMTMAALLCVQVQSSRGRAGVLLLVAAAAATAAWEIIWLGSWLVDFEFIGPYYNYGDVLCFACIVTAACFSQHRGLFPSGAANPERRLDGFLPALAALMGIAMVAGTLATTKRIETWIIVGLVSLCTLLLITRQRNVRAELDALDRQLAARASDARLTELVRRSNDLIVVVDRAGMVSFASPAARSMLCTPASRIKGTPAVRLFGTSHESSMRRFLDCVASGGDALETMEIRVERPYGDKRVLTLAAADQLANR
jgi:PAS domain S-box-containing protein